MKHLLVLLITALALPTAVDANIMEQYEKRNNNKCSFNNAQFKASAYVGMGVQAFNDDYKFNRYCIDYDNRIILYRKGGKEGYRDYETYEEGLVGYQTSEYRSGGRFLSSHYNIILWVVENNKLYRLQCFSDESDQCSGYINKNLMGEKIVRGSIIEGDWLDIEGEWLDNKKTGKGTETWKDGTKYIGDFVDGIRTGKGTVTFSTGGKYEGSFLNGLENGKGTYLWKDGTKYVGDFVDGIRTGKGTLTYSNGVKFVGDFVDGKKNGKGTEIGIYGFEKYEGDFVDNKRNGKGTLTYINGAKFVGDFVDGKSTGYGEFTNQYGLVQKGQWLNNSLIKRY